MGTLQLQCMCTGSTQATADIALQGHTVLPARGFYCRALQEDQAVLVRLGVQLVLQTRHGC